MNARRINVKRSHFPELNQNIKELLKGRKNITYVASFLKCWTNYKAFEYMLDTLKDAVESNRGIREEVQQAPELYDLFVRNLRKSIDLHITENTFINYELLGDKQAYKEWQQAGYPLERSHKTYKQRIRYWKILFWKLRKYGAVILSRNTNYPPIQRGEIPYWYLWEYGNKRYSRWGKPSPVYDGAHFIESALKKRVEYESVALGYLDLYALNTLDGKPTVVDPFVDSNWLSVARKLEKHGVIKK